MMATPQKPLTPARNYGLDFLKFLLTLAVFFVHTTDFAGANTRIIPDLHLERIGYWSVHFFFMISGMLMASSRMRSQCEDAGRETLSFIVRKARGIALPYVVAFLMCYALTLVFAGIQDNCSVYALFGRLPELFGVQLSGTNTSSINGPAWYISAMFIVMVPLYYILSKHTTFFLYVFAPVGALLSFGYIKNNEIEGFRPHAWNVISTCGILRAFCGICFGVVAYLIFSHLLDRDFTRRQRVLLTVLQLALYGIIFVPLFSGRNDYVTMYPIMVAAPIPLAITFSGKSYISQLFRSEKWRFLPPLSLAIYLTHAIARSAVLFWFKGISYKSATAIMALITVGLCVLYFALIRLVKFLYPRIVKFLKTEKKA